MAAAPPVAPAPVVPAAGAAGAKPAAAKTGAAAPAVVAATPAPAPVTQDGFVSFPKEKMTNGTMPATPLPEKLKFDESVLAGGNAASGQKLVSTGMCVACHTIRGNPSMQATLGPNLTHVGTRTTIGAGAFVGSNSSLVAPVKIGNGAYVGSGSVITKDVPDDALAVERSPQTNREGGAARYREMKTRDRKPKA